MRKRSLTQCAAVLALGMLAMPGSASAITTSYALHVEPPSAPPRTTFPYVGVAPPGNLTGSPLVLAASISDPRQQWLPLCAEAPGSCDLYGGIYTFDPQDQPPIKLYHRFSNMCLTRPNTTGNGTRPVMARCTRTQPTHFRQLWERFILSPSGPGGYEELTSLRSDMYIAEYWSPQYKPSVVRPTPGNTTVRCLDVTDFKNVPGTGIQLWRCTGGWNQRFKVSTVRTHP